MTNYTAHITIEAKTPLKVGSNNSDFLQDAPVQKDWNGLPMILGTSIAGVLRKDFQGNKDDIFGKENGSKVIFSNALLLDEKMEVYEGLLQKKSDFLKHFENLPIREHVKINTKGVVDGSGKFDEEVVYKGTRFKFSIELIEANQESFISLLNQLDSASFRLGSGSTKGFGKFKVVEIKTTSKECSSSLDDDFVDEKIYKKPVNVTSDYITYKLEITPKDFFLFGSGFGDEDADATPVYEQEIIYDTNDPEKSGLSDKKILLPASSIKGALAHRTTFHYNALVGNTIEAKNGVESIAEIFGEAKNSKQEIEGSKGKVLFSDCYEDIKNETKVFDHVSIDRFTGGAKDGALFQEKTIAQKDMWKIEIHLHKDVQGDELKAFELALEDIAIGMLPLGGMTTKGHGVFCGGLYRGEELLAQGDCNGE